jgi:hypothetical protein
MLLISIPVLRMNTEYGIVRINIHIRVSTLSSYSTVRIWLIRGKGRERRKGGPPPDRGVRKHPPYHSTASNTGTPRSTVKRATSRGVVDSGSFLGLPRAAADMYGQYL